MHVHIIGGGVIGLCTAWYLKAEGCAVTIIDDTDLLEGTSTGNAGIVVPSHFVPLASPGVIAKGVRWLFDAKSPFYIQPRLNWELVQWLWQFYRSCTWEKVERAAPLLWEFNEQSKALYRQFESREGFEFCFEEKGLLVFFKQAGAEQEERETAEKARALGLDARVLTAGEVRELEPGLRLDVRGGVYYPGDAHLYPNLFIRQLVGELKRAGVRFITKKAVVDFEAKARRIDRLLLAGGTSVPVRQVVLAAGSWTAKLAKQLNLRLLMQSGKGYSVTIPQPVAGPRIPAILAEAKVSVTPMGEDLRIGGTLEIGSISHTVNRKRLTGILEGFSRYYPDLVVPMPKDKAVWQGFRPCTPDGLPYLGPSLHYQNLTIATGHAMMGMSLGPATGRVVADLITEQKPSLDISLFRPERFG